ncbi:hypothetical protein ACIO3O_00440 [Streptomyces sp. NPDC087440]|uniref:hypothetical protein n=1 Tax=Streptomyces sp. NPDC087440 TaxID=3365790 RepID=UPI0037FFCAAC
MLSRRLQRTVTAEDAGLSRAPSTVSELIQEADPLRRLSALTRAELDPTRRHLLSSGLYSLAVLAAPEALQPHRKPPAGPAGAPGRAGRAEVEEMQTMTRVFAEAAQAHGPGHVRTALAAYLGHDATGYLHARATEDLHRQLLSGAAQLTILLGTMCADSGADALAQRYHQTGAQLSVEAGDASTLAIALRTMSAHAHDLGHRTPAVLNLAERAATRETAPIVQAYAQAHLAVVQAHHDKHAALTALTSCERLYEKAHTTPGPFTHYPVGALHYQRAETLAALGDQAGATRALTASLRLRSPAEGQARTLTRARLAESLLGQGHLDAALTHWQTFLDEAPGLHSLRIGRCLDAMRRLLNPHRHHRATAQLLTHAAALY